MCASSVVERSNLWLEMLIGLRLEALWYIIQHIQSSLAYIPTSPMGPLSLWQTTHPSVISLPLLALGVRLQRSS
jgi:hypothetical protein